MPYRLEATVEGTSSFPMDMLRYEGAFPATEADAQLIEKTFTNYGRWKIRVAKNVAQKPKKKWTLNWYFDRWASFGTTINGESFASSYFIDIRLGR